MEKNIYESSFECKSKELRIKDMSYLRTEKILEHDKLSQEIEKKEKILKELAKEVVQEEEDDTEFHIQEIKA